MDATDAEEYTQALGQIGSGWWRQIALGQRLGVPAALGLSTDEWVSNRLGGYIRLSIPERREAAKELTASVDDGGQGMSQREAAGVLGVSQSTLRRDARSEPNDSFGADDDSYSESFDSATPESSVPTEPEDEFARQEATSWQVWRAVLAVSGFREVAPSEFVTALPADRLEYVEPVASAVISWLTEVIAAATVRQSRQPVALGAERIMRGRDDEWLNLAP